MNDALQKNQFSGELPCWKVISAAPGQYHMAIQQATSDRKNMAIILHQDVAQRLLASIRRYCAENMDAQQAMQEKIAEIVATCYETELAYWKK
jgi:hypothetical protein